MKSRIFAVFASPRPADKSLSSSLHESYLGSPGGTEIERVFLSDLRISPCTGCNSCRITGKCIIHDDIEQIYTGIINAGMLTFSFPVYFTGVPSSLKSVIDRTHALWQIRKKLRESMPERKAVLFVTAGSRYHNMFLPSLTVMRHFLSVVRTEIDLNASEFLCNTDRHPEKITLFPDFTDTIDGNY